MITVLLLYLLASILMSLLIWAVCYTGDKKDEDAKANKTTKKV